MGEGNARPRLRFVDLTTRQCRASGSRGSGNPGHSAGPALWVSGKPATRPLTVPYRRVWPRRGESQTLRGVAGHGGPQVRGRRETPQVWLLNGAKWGSRMGENASPSAPPGRRTGKPLRAARGMHWHSKRCPIAPGTSPYERAHADPGDTAPDRTICTWPRH